MTKLSLPRRTLLRGLGGVALGLPFLEVMQPRRATAQQGQFPKRYIVCFGGYSLITDVDSTPSQTLPSQTGAAYDLKQGLAPLAGVQDYVTVVSGMDLNALIGDGFHWHANLLLAGGRPAGERDDSLTYPTSDQIVADAIGSETTFKFLAYRAQVSSYLAGNAVENSVNHGTISGRMTANRIEPVIPNSSPKAAFDTLFNAFAPTDPAGQAAAQLRLDKRKSILDLVDRTLGGVHGKLSVSDQVRLSQHWDEIRALETRLSAIAPPQGGSCEKLADPGADPDVGGASDDPTAVDVNQGYSDEDTRAGVLNRLLAMAMICDLTRVGTLMYTHFQSFMNAQAIVGRTINLHSVNHEGTAEDIAVISAWHMKHFAELVTLLRDAPEGDGNVLDNSAVVYLNEGGEGDNPDRTDGSHATKGLAGLIAGRAGGLKSGVHLLAPAGANHPGNLLITAMNAVGVPTNTYGDITGPMPGLT
jgi:hypothetical protein